MASLSIYCVFDLGIMEFRPGLKYGLRHERSLPLYEEIYHPLYAFQPRFSKSKRFLVLLASLLDDTIISNSQGSTLCLEDQQTSSLTKGIGERFPRGLNFVQTPTDYR